MATYLFFDDIEPQWNRFNTTWIQSWIKKGELPNIVAHPLNGYQSEAEEYKAKLKKVLESDTLDLLISDVALGGMGFEKKRATWITTLLKEIIEESTSIQKKLKRRGLGLILITQHGGEIAGEILADARVFLDEWFTWAYLNKNDFNSRFLNRFQEVAANFQEIDNRWVANDRVNAYLNLGLGEQTIDVDYIAHKHLQWRQIIAIESKQPENPRQPATKIYYTDNLADSPIKVHIIETSDFNGEGRPKRLLDFFRVTPLHDRAQNYDDFNIELTYFLHIKQRPLTFINYGDFDWEARPHKNHGRNLTLKDSRIGKDRLVVFHCRFEHLNTHFL